MSEIKSEVKRSVGLEDTVLDTMCRYDEEMLDFFVDIRLLLSLLRFKSISIDESVFQEMRQYAISTFVPKLLERYSEELLVFDGSEEKLAGSNRSDVRFLKDKPRKLSKYFERALVETININVRRRDFTFDVMTLLNKLSKDRAPQLALIKYIVHESVEFLKTIQASQVTQDLLQRKREEFIQTILPPVVPKKLSFIEGFARVHLHPMRLSEYAMVCSAVCYWFDLIPSNVATASFMSSLVAWIYLFMQAQKNSPNEGLHTNAVQNIFFSSLFVVTLQGSEVTSFKEGLLVFFALMAAFIIYDAKIHVSNGLMLREEYRLPLSIRTIRRRKNEQDNAEDIVARDIIFDPVTEDKNTKTSEEEKDQKKDREAKQPEPVGEEEEENWDDGIERKKIKTRPMVAARIGDEPELKKYPVIRFESLGPAAIYDPDPHSKLVPTVFPCGAFGVRNVFVHIASDLSDELERLEDKSIAPKFKELVKKGKSAKSEGEEGTKILTAKYIKLGDDNYLPCFELKPLKRHGNKRLLGCMETVEVNGKNYEVIVFREYEPNAHQGKKLELALMRLQNKLNQLHQAPAPVAASPRSAA